MIDKTKANILIGTLNLLAVGASLQPQQATKLAQENTAIQKLNVKSLQAIESTWLKVPNTCKARGFNASPTHLEGSQVSAQVQSIYSSFEV